MHYYIFIFVVFISQFAHHIYVHLMLAIVHLSKKKKKKKKKKNFEKTIENQRLSFLIGHRHHRHQPSSVPLQTLSAMPLYVPEIRMSDTEIALHDEAGEAEFLGKERPLWPCIPSVCTVPVCSHFGKLSTFNVFRDHWTQKHCKHLSHYKCQGCGKRFRNTKHVRSHLKSKVHKGQTVTIKYVQTHNDEYINPRGILPYQLGTQEQRRRMLAFQREVARQQRQHEILQAKDDFSKIPYYGENVCRDERVVNLWHSAGHRRRVPLSDRSRSELLNQ